MGKDEKVALEAFDRALFIERFIKARQRVNMSESDLASASGIPRHCIINYENGKLPRIDRICVIAKTLNVSLDYLCGMEEKEYGI